MYQPVTRTFAAAVTAAGLSAVLATGAAGQTRQASQRAGQRPDQQRAGDSRGTSRGPVKWWQVYSTELRLTPNQASQIDAIFESTFPQLRARYEELNKREDQLSALISANDATEAEVLRQADQVEAIRGDLSKTRVLMLFRMRRVLSPEQRDKLQALQKARDRDRDRGAPPPRR